MLMTPEEDQYPTLIHRLIHDTNHAAFRAWTWVINVLIYLSCVAIALESIEVVKADFGTELVQVLGPRWVFTLPLRAADPGPFFRHRGRCSRRRRLHATTTRRRRRPAREQVERVGRALFLVTCAASRSH